MWELMGNEIKEGFAREAVEAYRVAVVQPDWVSTPRGVTAFQSVQGGHTSALIVVGGPLQPGG